MEAGNLSETFCRLCFCTIIDTNFLVIEEVIREVLKVVLPEVDLGETNEHVICRKCSVKLFAALSFKATCLDTEDVIFPFVTSEEVSVVDLKEVYLKEKGNIQLISISENQKICRLCFQLVMYGFVSLNEVNVDIINKYIPQVNINATKEPVICELCLDSLHTHGNFIKNCIDVQKQYEQSYIKNEEIDIKLEERGYNSDPSSHDFIEGTISNNKTNHASEDLEKIIVESLQCEDEQVQMIDRTKSKINKSESSIHTHKLTHNVWKEQMYKCGRCKYKYKSRYKSNIKAHRVVHRRPSEIRMYTCDKCSFETKHKTYLRVHQVKHKNPSEVEMYKCDECSFKTKYKTSLKLHQLKHKNSSEVQMYKCDVCDYKTKFKRHLKLHQITHKDPSDIKMYECDECSFETKYKRALNTHQITHKNPSEIQMYKCDVCNRTTKSKYNLIEHQLTHKDPSVIQMHKCDICSFETKYKKCLKRHQLTKHKSLSEIQMYTCYTCGFETKHKKGLQNHQLIHRKRPKTRKKRNKNVRNVNI